MPQQRDVLGEDRRLAPHAASNDKSPPSAHRLDDRPPDIAATVASSRLLEPDQSTSTAPELHCPIDLVDDPHIHVMYSTRDGQRMRERGATAAPWFFNRRRAAPPPRRPAWRSRLDRSISVDGTKFSAFAAALSAASWRDPGAPEKLVQAAGGATADFGSLEISLAVGPPSHIPLCERHALRTRDDALSRGSDAHADA